MSSTSNVFLKIIYFDEMFVSDFMQVIAGGELKKTTEFISEVNSEIEGNASMDAGIGTEQSGLSKIFSFLSGGKINIEVGADANAMRKSERLAKNILENTLLADFIALLNQINVEPRIRDVKVSKNSQILKFDLKRTLLHI